MAKKKELKHVKKKINNRGNATYPWSNWFSKKKIRLVRGQHFSCKTGSMLQQVYSKAKDHNVFVSISVDEMDLIVSVTK